MYNRKKLHAKRTFLMIAAVSAACLISGCGLRNAGMPQVTPQVPLQAPAATSQTLPASQTERPTRTPDPVPASTPAPTPVPTPVPAPVPTAAPTPVPAPPATPVPAQPKVRITKSPTDETVDEGSKAIFIARAENASGSVWILVSPDAKTVYRLDEASSYFPGLSSDGQGTEKIHLYNIPYALNGWRIQCYFEGNGGPAYTSGAILHVNKAAPIYSNTAGGITVAGGTNESRAAELAVSYRDVVLKYADYSHWNLSDVQNFTFHQEQNYGEYRLTLTRGAINLVCTLDTYPADGTCYPVGLAWYENGTDSLVQNYIFGSYDPESWNHFEKTILDITARYGDGTAGQGMQFGNGGQ